MSDRLSKYYYTDFALAQSTMMIDLAEQFMQDKDTLLNLYLDAIIDLETLQYKFEADDLQNRFQFGINFSCCSKCRWDH